MTHNTGLDWKIYVNGENSFSVYYDHPSEGFWFRNYADAEQFRHTLANDPNLDPFTVFATYWFK